MELWGLHIADVVTLSIYLIGITALGIWMSKTVRDTTDYFVGGRRFGKLLATFFSLGAGTHSDQAVSVAAKTYTVGMSGIWYQWLWLFITPFYWVLSLINRRCRCLTLGDFFEARFSRSVAMLCVLVGILSFMINIGVMLKGTGAVISAVSDDINEDWAIAITTLLFVVYGVAGGLAAAVVTDFVQGILTIIFSFMLLPLALYALGGFSGLHAGVAETFAIQPPPGMESSSQMWSLIAPGEITLFYIVIIVINALVGIVAQPGGVPGAQAARTEEAVQFGAVAGNLIKRVCTVSWTLLGMCAFALFPDLLERGKVDQAFGLVASEFLPQLMPGLIGIFIASLLAAVMSSCDMFMLVCAGLFTQNLYRPLTRNKKPESHYLTVGRIASVGAVAGGVFFAYQYPTVITGLELFWKISAMMGIAFWAGLIWRRTTTAGAWAGTLAAFAALLFTSDINIGSWTIWSFNEQVANRHVTTLDVSYEELLPEADDGTTEQLNAEQIPENVRSRFAELGINLTEDATLTADIENARWVVRDRRRSYTVVREPSGRIVTDIGDPVTRSLDDGILPAFFSPAFEEQVPIELTEEAELATETLSFHWVIKDGGRVYSLIRHRGEDTIEVFGNRLPRFLLWQGELYLPWQMIFYLVTGTTALIVVSLLTKRHSEEQLNHFYGVIHTPVEPDEVIDEPFTLPKGRSPAPIKKLINHPELEIPVPQRRTVMGVLVVAGIAVVMIIGVVLLVRIGAGGVQP
jgi:Na+/proline symporter